MARSGATWLSSYGSLPYDTRVYYWYIQHDMELPRYIPVVKPPSAVILRATLRRPDAAVPTVVYGMLRYTTVYYGRLR